MHPPGLPDGQLATIWMFYQVPRLFYAYDAEEVPWLGMLIDECSTDAGDVLTYFYAQVDDAVLAGLDSDVLTLRDAFTRSGRWALATVTHGLDGLEESWQDLDCPPDDALPLPGLTISGRLV